MRGIYLKDNNNNKCLVAPYYRVGDLFLTTNATNPSNYLGGTWELFGPGRVLVCVDTSNSNFNTVKKTGGAATHTHTQGATGAASGNTGAASGNTGSTTLTVNQMPSHEHTLKDGVYANNLQIAMRGDGGGSSGQVPTWSQTTSHSRIIAAAVGGGKGHTHSLNSHTHTLNSHTHTNPTTAAASSLQPFITCYVWIRTA